MAIDFPTERVSRLSSVGISASGLDAQLSLLQSHDSSAMASYQWPQGQGFKDKVCATASKPAWNAQARRVWSMETYRRVESMVESRRAHRGVHVW